LGEYRLKDLTRAERLFQLGEGDFPPLKSLNRTNLPVAAWPLIGRERELEAIRGHVAAGTRLLTLTGPGGSGKTRLALQAAAELADDFRDGVFFVALAPLRDVAAVHAAVAQALELQPDDDVVARLAASRLLLVIDNAEHLAGVERVVGELLVGDVVALVTSRAPLHLAAERELAVDPLPQDAAVELFVTRAAAAGRAVMPDGVVVELCRRLDNLCARTRAGCGADEAPFTECDAGASGCGAAAAARRSHATCRSASRRCARRSRGATTCSTRPSGPPSAGSPCSAARAGSTRQRLSPAPASRSSPRSSTRAS